MKNVYTIAADAPFLDTLARELWRRADGDGLRLSQHLILLPTRRACRHLGAAFARIAGGKPVLLPRLRPLGDIDEDEMSFADDADLNLPPAIAPLKRLMLLTQQVQKRDPGMSCDQALLSALALARFLDQTEIEQCDREKLPRLVAEQELAEHWRQTVAFLEIVTRHWPLILAEQGCMDPAARRNAVLQAQAAAWRKQPPTHPVIAAGSTGSIPATAELLDVIAGLPQGAVILPGLDRTLDHTAWDAIDDTHPQYSINKLLDKMGVERAQVADWGDARPASPRMTLLSESMRPAALTERWRDLRGKLGADCVAGLTRLTLDHPQEEARVIALRLRAHLEQTDTAAALVTADRALAARVAALLRRWGVAVDDSGGAMLAALPLGAFLDLILAAASPQAGAVDLLALLKHPLAACGMTPAACRIRAREGELRLRRGEAESFDWIKNMLLPLTRHWTRPLPLAQHIAAHIAVAEAVAASDSQTGAARLWSGDIGDAAAEWLDQWREAGDDFPPLTGGDYAALFAALAAAKTMRPVRDAHPRLSILGPLEARLADADLVILGGMNEGQWPPDAGFDPWMSRPMRRDFGLPLPELRIGLSAHDFVQLCSAPRVLLTRSSRSGGSPTVPSRFVLQLDAVLRAAGLSDDAHDALLPVEPWRVWAHALDMPAAFRPCPPPHPRPALAARPAQLSVTEIGTWLRNPYAIYAKHVLKLRKLDELGAELDAADRGTMIHAALEQFARAFPGDLPDDAEARLLDIGRAVFAQAHANPRVQTFWWQAFTVIAAWFVAQSRERRAAGASLLQAEATGRIVIGGFTLQGRADRIDRLPTGGLSIVDYKTGAPPSQAAIDAGIEPQLPLLALIAAKGGFDAIAAAATNTLEHWVLKGGRGGCYTAPLRGDIAGLAARAESGLEGLIAAYADPATPYRAVPKPGWQPRYNDYAHLSRLAEWGRTAEEL